MAVQDKMAQIEESYGPYEPTVQESVKITSLRRAYKTLAVAILANTPGSRAQSVALTELESSYHWAKAAVEQNT